VTSLLPFAIAFAVPFLCYYALAAYVASKDPEALRHLGALHPRRPHRRKRHQVSESPE
jgi:hypothetical protein